MAIKGNMDLGIGVPVQNAYTRIVDFWYRPEIPEVEIEIHNYFSKDARNSQIIRDFVIDYMKTATLNDDQKAWLQTNIIAKSVYPLQTLKMATCKLQGIPTTKSAALPFFYRWLKTHQVHGDMTNISDDMDTSNVAIAAFKKAHPEIFGTG